MPPERVLDIRLALASDEELAELRGALLAARASELAEASRRSARHAFGYGDASQRDSMSAEAAKARRRHDLLDRLLEALGDAARSPGSSSLGQHGHEDHGGRDGA